MLLIMLYSFPILLELFHVQHQSTSNSGDPQRNSNVMAMAMDGGMATRGQRQQQQWNAQQRCDGNSGNGQRDATEMEGTTARRR
jgi:hypothetical protein